MAWRSLKTIHSRSVGKRGQPRWASLVCSRLSEAFALGSFICPPTQFLGHIYHLGAFLVSVSLITVLFLCAIPKPLKGPEQPSWHFSALVSFPMVTSGIPLRKSASQCRVGENRTNLCHSVLWGQGSQEWQTGHWGTCQMVWQKYLCKTEVGKEKEHAVTGCTMKNSVEDNFTPCPLVAAPEHPYNTDTETGWVWLGFLSSEMTIPLVTSLRKSFLILDFTRLRLHGQRYRTNVTDGLEFETPLQVEGTTGAS